MIRLLLLLAADPLALVGWPFLMMTTRQQESCSGWAAAG